MFTVDVNNNAMQRRYKSRLVPQGSTSVCYTCPIPCDILPPHIEFVLEFSEVQASLEMRLKDFCCTYGLFPLGAICHGLLKNLHVPAEDRTGGPSISSLALYHVAIKAGLYRKALYTSVPYTYSIPCDTPNRVCAAKEYHIFHPGSPQTYPPLRLRHF